MTEIRTERLVGALGCQLPVSSGEWVLRQTGASEQFIRALRRLASDQGLLLRDLYGEALSDFLRHRDVVKRKREVVEYLASPQRPKVVNVRLTADLTQAVDQAAEADDVSSARLIYTALVRYARERGYG